MEVCGFSDWLIEMLRNFRTDPAMRAWFKKIKRKKGGGVARVAVMRRMATILWHMLTKRKTYAEVRSLGIGLAP